MARGRGGGRSAKGRREFVSAAGWAPFFIGILIAAFFGGAVRALLSARQVALWIERTMAAENPPFRIDLADARIVLAEGIFPRFGIRVRDLTVTPSDLCRVPWRLRVDEVFLPGDWRVLIGGRLRFGTLEAGEVTVEKAQECVASAAAEPSSVAPPAKVGPAGASPRPIVSDRVRRFFTERWARELENSARWLDGLNVADLKIEAAAPGGSDLRAQNLELLFARSGGGAKFDGQILLPAQWSEDGAPLAMAYSIVADRESLGLVATIAIKEGQIALNQRVSLTDFVQDGRMLLTFIPGQQVVRWLKQWAKVSDPLSFKRSWLSGRLEWAGDLSAAEPLRKLALKEFKLTGDSGEVRCPQVEFAVRDGRFGFYPFEVEFEQLSLRYLLEATGRKGYSGVIGDFGRLSGGLRIESEDAVEFKGQLSELALNFSRQSVRARQIVTSMSGQLRLAKGRVTGRISDWQFASGKARGEVTFNLDRSLRNGVFQVRFDELLFQPEVARVMIGGQLDAIALYGQGRLEGGHVIGWSGEFGTTKMAGPDWQVERLRVRSEFAGQVMILGARAERAEFAVGSEFHEQSRPLLETAGMLGQALVLKHLSSRFEVSSGLVKWTNAVASSQDEKMIVAVSGQWTPGRHIQGVVNADLPRFKMLRWDVEGVWPALNWIAAQRTADKLGKKPGQ